MCSSLVSGCNSRIAQTPVLTNWNKDILDGVFSYIAFSCCIMQVLLDACQGVLQTPALLQHPLLLVHYFGWVLWDPAILRRRSGAQALRNDSQPQGIFCTDLLLVFTNCLLA